LRARPPQARRAAASDAPWPRSRVHALRGALRQTASRRRQGARWGEPGTRWRVRWPGQRALRVRGGELRGGGEGGARARARSRERRGETQHGASLRRATHFAAWFFEIAVTVTASDSAAAACGCSDGGV
jgi:hypothetical protein